MQEYIRRGKENAVSGQWMRQLENASARRHIARLEALRVRTQNTLETLYGRYSDALSAALHRTYESGYYHTAFELQKGFGIGWDVAPLQPRAVEKVLEKPWAADGYNFSERLWRDREKLIGTVHTELSRSLLLGEDPQKAIDRIARTMETNRYNAGRLVMTESAYFAGAAQGQAYRELGVERYEIVATLDSHTSEICRELDGKTFEMREYAAGVTAPPFHVYCRSTTAPAADTDFEAAGRRAARGADGKVYSVPGDMTYEEWEKAFRDGGEKKGLTELFQPMSAYKKADGSFDLEAAKEDYKKFLQTVPEPYKIYLEQSMDAVQYSTTEHPEIVCAYRFSDDTFLYNPRHPNFYDYDFRLAATHELGHRIDRFFVRSWEHADFRDAIQKAAAVLDENPRFFIEHCEDNDTDGFLSDILSGICRGKYIFPAKHSKDYWERPYRREREIFTNLFSLCSYQDEKKLNFLREHFPEIVHCFELLTQAL